MQKIAAMNNFLSKFILTISLFLSVDYVSGQTFLFQESFDEANGSNVGVDNTANNVAWNSTCPFANDAQDILMFAMVSLKVEIPMERLYSQQIQLIFLRSSSRRNIAGYL